MPVEVTAPTGGRAIVRCRADDSIEVAVDAGEVLDEVVLRSYCLGAAHQALGWVGSEGIAVDAAGVVHDLTMRSFGILPARDMPPVTVRGRAPDGDRPAGERLRRGVRRGGRRPLAGRRPPAPLADPEPAGPRTGAGRPPSTVVPGPR